jgi:hypothetical protein
MLLVTSTLQKRQRRAAEVPPGVYLFGLFLDVSKNPPLVYSRSNVDSALIAYHGCVPDGSEWILMKHIGQALLFSARSFASHLSRSSGQTHLPET